MATTVLNRLNTCRSNYSPLFCRILHSFLKFTMTKYHQNISAFLKKVAIKTKLNGWTIWSCNEMKWQQEMMQCFRDYLLEQGCMINKNRNKEKKAIDDAWTWEILLWMFVHIFLKRAECVCGLCVVVHVVSCVVMVSLLTSCTRVFVVLLSGPWSILSCVPGWKCFHKEMYGSMTK